MYFEMQSGLTNGQGAYEPVAKMLDTLFAQTFTRDGAVPDWPGNLYTQWTREARYLLTDAAQSAFPLRLRVLYNSSNYNNWIYLNIFLEYQLGGQWVAGREVVGAPLAEFRMGLHPGGFTLDHRSAADRSQVCSVALGRLRAPDGTVLAGAAYEARGYYSSSTGAVIDLNVQTSFLGPVRSLDFAPSVRDDDGRALIYRPPVSVGGAALRPDTVPIEFWLIGQQDSAISSEIQVPAYGKVVPCRVVGYSNNINRLAPVGGL